MKQFAIIGLGNFGYYLAMHLYEKDHEVLAIDKNPKPVQRIKDKVSQAMIADAQVVAIKEIVPDRVHLIPTAQFVVKDSDVLILLGPNDSLDKLCEVASYA